MREAVAVDAGIAPEPVDAALDAESSVADATVAPEPKCVRIGYAPFVDFDMWGLMVQTPAQLSCQYAVDGGMPVYGPGVITRKDGSPMLEAATAYSLRWKDASLTALVVYSGATSCDAEKIYEELPDPNMPGLFGVLPTLPASGCRDVVPTQTALSLQVDGIFPGAAVELCEEVCPAP